VRAIDPLRFALSLQHKALAIKIVHNEKSGFIQIDCHQHL
jgi:hypothetical protein